MSKRDSAWKFPQHLCKYNHNKDCICGKDKCKDCSHNPERFDDRKITKGQIIFLKTKGYIEEDIKDWEYIKACREISRLKGNNYCI